MDQYIKDRLDPQIDWYDQKATSAQKYHKWITFSEAVITFGIAPVALFLPDEAAIRSVTIGLGFLLSVLLATKKIFRFQENWINYRRTAQLLKSEKEMALSQAGIYAQADNLRALLTEQAEAIMTKELVRWGAFASQRPEFQSSNDS